MGVDGAGEQTLRTPTTNLPPFRLRPCDTEPPRWHAADSHLNQDSDAEVLHVPSTLALVLRGRPGCGKSAVAAQLERDLGLLHISIERAIRAAILSRSTLGQQVRCGRCRRWGFKRARSLTGENATSHGTSWIKRCAQARPCRSNRRRRQC